MTRDGEQPIRPSTIASVIGLLPVPIPKALTLAWPFTDARSLKPRDWISRMEARTLSIGGPTKARPCTITS
jgi:hypothetical protein